VSKALKVVLLLVLLVVVLYAGRRIAESYPWSMRPQPSPWSEREAERVTVEAAIQALMVDENITDLSKYADNSTTVAPVRTFEAGEATNDMSVFPSVVWHVYDGPHGYMRVPTTKYYYTVEVHGTVSQFHDAAKTFEYPAYGPPELTPEERRSQEKYHVQQGVEQLMRLEGLTDLSLRADGTPSGSPVRTYGSGEATNDMAMFPSQAWHLYREMDEGTTPLTMFFHQRTTECCYTVEHDGTVRQFADAAKTVEYNSAE
jgi:hypothetical protein